MLNGLMPCLIAMPIPYRPKWSSRYNVTRADQWYAVGQVMRAIDADCIIVVEAPNKKTGRSTVDMLERFANEFGCAPRRRRWVYK